MNITYKEHKRLFEAEFGPIHNESYDTLDYYNFLETELDNCFCRKSQCGTCYFKHDCDHKHFCEDIGCEEYMSDYSNNYQYYVEEWDENGYQ